MNLDEKRVTIDYLRTQVTKLYAKSAYRLAAQRLRELEVLGARDASWWGYSLRLAAALGDVDIVNAAIIALAKEPEALLRGLRAAWANAVAHRHIAVAAAIDQHVRQLAPGDVEFRVLGLIDSLAGADPLNTNLQQLTATPLRMGTIDPRLLKTLIRALHGAGFGADARRMFDYYLMKHAPVADLDRQDTALLACEMKMFSLAMSLTANDADPKARYIHSLACHQEWAWSDCEGSQHPSSKCLALLCQAL